MAEETNGQRILSIDEMLNADDVEYRTVPAWKIKDPKTGEMIQGYVRIASLNAQQVADFRDTLEGPAKRTMGVRLFVDSLVDENGKRIGNSTTHYIAFQQKSNRIQDAVLQAILELNGMTVTKKDVDAAKKE